MELLKQCIRLALPEKTIDRLRHVRNVFSHDPPLDYETIERRELMRKAFHALAFNNISGDYLEFGSASGTTFALAYKESRRAKLHCKLWSFDSFRGLPPLATSKDQHPSWAEGSYSVSLQEFIATCQKNGIPNDDYTTVPGYYEDTIGQEDTIGISLPRDVALAYVDCDLYSSTETVLRFLGRRMKHGMIVALDDYYCYSAHSLSGERRACLEFLQRDSRFHFSPFAQFGWHGMSFIVEDRVMHPSPQPAIA
jgi:hypothetical protein